MDYAAIYNGFDVFSDIKPTITLWATNISPTSLVKLKKLLRNYKFSYIYFSSDACFYSFHVALAFSVEHAENYTEHDKKHSK